MLLNLYICAHITDDALLRNVHETSSSYLNLHSTTILWNSGSDDDRPWLDCSVIYVQSKRTDEPPQDKNICLFVFTLFTDYTLKLTNMLFPPCSSLKVVPVGASRGVKKLMQERVPDMNKFEDISELLMK